MMVSMISGVGIAGDKDAFGRWHFRRNGLGQGVAEIVCVRGIVGRDNRADGKDV
jgi:hypothetical protein